MLYQNNLISVIMRTLEDLIPSGETYDKQASYLMSFFIYDISESSISGSNMTMMKR